MSESKESAEVKTDGLETGSLALAEPEAVRQQTRWNRMRRWLSEHRPEFSVGTLKYTGFSMLMVCVWLLWGDFIHSMLDGSVFAILPKKMKMLGASDMTIQLLTKTLAYAVSFMTTPVVSFKSDRTRTRWGRRIPYLMWSSPFVGLCLIGIGCYEPLTNLVMGGAQSATILGVTVSQAAMTMIVIGAIILALDFSNIFVNTVYYYLFNDVVPSRYLSRFLSLFRMVGLLAGMSYDLWIFPHSLTHFGEIFVISGIAYAIGFCVMCFMIKEGTYPPPPENADGKRGFLSSCKTYWNECFTHRLYWYFFIANACTFMTGLTGTFGILRDIDVLGLTLVQLGVLRFWHKWVSFFLQYPAGWVSDRWHPLNIYLWSHILYMGGSIAQCVWIFKDFGPRGNLIYMYVITMIFQPLYAIAGASELPMYMRLLPKDRYGQFCSANGLVRAAAMLIGSTAAGFFIQSLTPYVGIRRYTWIPAWTLIFQIIAAVFLVLLYKQWKLHGGYDNYVPPGTEPVVPRGFPVLMPEGDRPAEK